MKPRLPSLTKPGDLVDRKGVPIHPGDLIRTDHFIDSRRRRHYLYHVVTQDEAGVLHAIPTGWLALGERDRPMTGGRCYLHSMADDDGVTLDSEVIHGHGPCGYIDFSDRPKRKPPASAG